MVDNELFRLDNVHFSYNGQPAVAGLSLSMAAGKFYGVVGPNGSGKTTMLDLLLGVKKPDEGDIHLKRKSLASYDKISLAKEMALVPQEFQINFAFTVLEVVMMGRHPYLRRFGAPLAEDYDIARAAMAALDIEQFENRMINGLSGGEKQRVVAARSLAQQPQVLMLDEATSNLDIRHTLSILQVAKRLVSEQGKTVIAVLHNLNLAGAYCDELIFLKAGHLHSTGDTCTALSPETIKDVFEIDCRVAVDDYSGAPQVSYKYEM